MSAQLEEERKQYEEQLELVIVSLKDDADNAELLALKDELGQMVKLLDDSLAELKPKAGASKPAPEKSSILPPSEQKWSRENHPAFKKPSAHVVEEKEQEQAPVSYQVNDNVIAKWITGDKAFYPARITSVTGSSTAPIYTVKFKSYDTVETLRAKDIRPIAQKRKADGSLIPANAAPAPGVSAASSAVSAGTGKSGPNATATASNNGIVMSAGAEMYPNAQQGSKAADGNADENPKKKFKKIKATKELEAGKSKWQEFSTKGKHGKSTRKDSMFRTPEGVHGRGKHPPTSNLAADMFADFNLNTVGFTGSGQPMRKDVTRSRHSYQQNEELD